MPDYSPNQLHANQSPALRTGVGLHCVLPGDLKVAVASAHHIFTKGVYAAKWGDDIASGSSFHSRGKTANWRRVHSRGIDVGDSFPRLESSNEFSSTSSLLLETFCDAVFMTISIYINLYHHVSAIVVVIRTITPRCERWWRG